MKSTKAEIDRLSGTPPSASYVQNKLRGQLNKQECKIKEELVFDHRPQADEPSDTPPGEGFISWQTAYCVQEVLGEPLVFRGVAGFSWLVRRGYWYWRFTKHMKLFGLNGEVSYRYCNCYVYTLKLSEKERREWKR